MYMYIHTYIYICIYIYVCGEGVLLYQSLASALACFQPLALLQPYHHRVTPREHFLRDPQIRQTRNTNIPYT